MLKRGTIVYIKVQEEFADHALVITMDRQYSGILYYKDFADRGTVGHRPMLDVYFQAVVEEQDQTTKHYIFKQIPLIWKDVKAKIKELRPGKELLCRVEIVKKTECELAVLEPALSSGEYHIQGILKLDEVKKALKEIEPFRENDGKPLQQSIHDILWEGDLVYTCCIDVDYNNYKLILSLDTWLKKREKISERKIRNNHKADINYTALKTKWAAENREIQLRAAAIKTKVTRVILLDNEEYSGMVARELGRAIGIRIDFFTRSDMLFAALKRSPGLYHTCLMDYHLAPDDPVKDGMSAALEVHKITPDLPVVIFSAYLETIHPADDILKNNIFGPFPRFQGGDLGLLTCLEIGAGIKPYTAYEEENTGEIKKQIKLPHLQEQISIIAHKHERLYSEIDGLFLFGFPEDSLIPRCYYNRKQDYIGSALEKTDLTFFHRVISSQTEIWLHDWNDSTEAATMKSLQGLFSFRSIVGIPLAVHGIEKYLLIATSRFDYKPDSLGREQLRYAAALFTNAIMEYQYTLDRMSYLRTYTLGSIIEGIIHDLNHKLNDLQRSSNNLQLSYDKTSLAELDSIFTGIKSLLNDTRVYNDHILTLQQNTGGAESLDKIIEIIRKVMDSFTARRNTIVRIKTSVPQLLVPGIESRTILFNLLHNAVRYGKPTPDSQGFIEITTETISKKQVNIRIQDHGIGMHKAYFARIFDRGFSTGKGSGLGLAICREIIQLIGGKIEVENSILYGGTTFRIALPVQEGNK